MKNKFSSSLFGMHCSNCANSIEKKISGIKGVDHVHVNFHAKKIFVEGTFKQADVDMVVQNMGYSFKKIEKTYLAELVCCWVVSIFSFAVDVEAFFILGLLIALLVFAGKELVKAGIASFIEKDYKMESLIFIGVFGAMLHHVFSLFQGTHGMGREGIILLTIYLTGQYLEGSLKKKADLAVQGLLDLMPEEVIFLKGTKSTKEHLGNIKKGDCLIVLPGQTIPLDGVVVEGASEIDESLITGESQLVNKDLNDSVTGGTSNISGRIVVKVSAAGDEGYLSRLVEMVEDASATKIPVQGLVDKIVAIFIPIVLWAAALAGICWIAIPEKMEQVNRFLVSVLNIDMEPLSWFMVVLAVLVVSCPCPLGIATPLALFIGAGRGAQIGLIIRDGKGLEALKSCKVLVLDKTGTLTTGKPKVHSVIPIGKYTEKDVLKHASSAEEGSDHPIAKAILKHSEKKKIKWNKLTGYKYHFGSGVEGFDERKNKIMAGNTSWILKDSFNSHKNIPKDSTLVAVSINEEPIGLISLRDEIRENALETVAKIKNMKIKVIIASGDREDSVKAVAEKLSIKNYFHSQKPEDKLSLIKKYEREKTHVIFAGDGVNDAPALAAATVGIAMGEGSDLAKQNGSLVLPKGNLSNIYKAIILSQKTFSVVGQNLFWAAIYNILAIPLAFFGVLHPIIAQTAMVCSDIIVITNSLRLQKMKL